MDPSKRMKLHDLQIGAVEWNDGEPPDSVKDGRLLLLIVCYQDDGDQGCEVGATDDVVRYWRTIGQCALADTGENVWRMVGWNWCQDCFCDGPTNVRIVKWVEFPRPPIGFDRDDS